MDKNTAWIIDMLYFYSIKASFFQYFSQLFITYV